MTAPPRMARLLLLGVYVLQQASYILLSFAAARSVGASHMGVYATVQALAYTPLASITGALESFFISEHMRRTSGLVDRIAAMAVVATVFLLAAAALLPFWKLGDFGWGLYGILAFASAAALAMPVEAARKGDHQLWPLLASRFTGLAVGTAFKLAGIIRGDLMLFAIGASVEIVLVAVVAWASPPSIWRELRQVPRPMPVLRRYAFLMLGSLPGSLSSRMPVLAAALWHSTQTAGVIGMGLTAAFAVPVLYSMGMSLLHAHLLRNYDRGFDHYKRIVGLILGVVYILTIFGMVVSYFLGGVVVHRVLGSGYADLEKIAPSLVFLSGMLCVNEQRNRYISIIGHRYANIAINISGLITMYACLYISKGAGIVGMMNFILLSFFVTIFLTTYFFKETRPWNSVILYSVGWRGGVASKISV